MLWIRDDDAIERILLRAGASISEYDTNAMVKDRAMNKKRKNPGYFFEGRTIRLKMGTCSKYRE